MRKIFNRTPKYRAYLLSFLIFSFVGLFPSLTSAIFIDMTSNLPGLLRGDGVSWGDYNNDGYEDLMVPAAENHKNLLYQNNHDGTFTEVASTAGISSQPHPYMSTWGDYDRDGNLDLYVEGGEAGASSALYRNNGDGTFTNTTTSAGVQHNRDGYTPSWMDYNCDENLDLYIPNFNDQPNRLYQNNGDGTFADVAGGAGAGGATHSTSALWVDYNRDGYPDLYLGNNQGDKINCTKMMGTVPLRMSLQM